MIDDLARSVGSDVGEAGSLREFGHRREIGELECRVGRGLGEHHPRGVPDRVAHIGRIRGVDEGELDTELGHHLRRETMRPAVDNIGNDDMVTGFE